MKKSTKISGILVIAAGLVLCIGVKAVFHACGAKDDGTFMNCHNAENVCAVIGGVIAALGLVYTLVSNRTVRIVASALAAVGGIAAAVVPNNVIHLCMMESMRCHAVMRPAVVIVGVISAVIAVVGAVLALRKTAEE